MRLVDAMLWPQRRPTKLKSDQFLSDPSPIIVLLCHLVTESVLLLNFAQIIEFVKVARWISLKGKSSKKTARPILRGGVIVDCPTQLTLMTWISQLCSMTKYQ